jgi:CelD/BcsL family acetyltransferase involved in cellulose biosynthesis
VRRARRVIPIREIRWLADGACDQGDILSKGDPRSVGRAVGEWLCQAHDTWDEIHLANVPADSEAVSSLVDTVRAGIACEYLTRSSPSFYIDVSTGDWHAYLATASKKFVRRDLPRIERRLAEIGEVTVTGDRTPEIGALLDDLGAIHFARQTELSRSSLYTDRLYVEFLRDALTLSTSAGRVSVWTMHVGPVIAAYLIGFIDNGVFYAWNMAHNPEFGAASPGKLLWARVIRGCFEDPAIREFSMMRGDTAYKLKWAPQSRDLLDIRVRNRSTRRSTLVNSLRRRPS